MYKAYALAFLLLSISLLASCGDIEADAPRDLEIALSTETDVNRVTQNLAAPNVTFTQLPPAPGGSYHGGSALFPNAGAGGKVLFYGGHAVGSGRHISINSYFSFDITSNAWSAAQPAGGNVAPRGSIDMVYSPVQDKAYFFGGVRWLATGAFPVAENYAVSLANTGVATFTQIAYAPTIGSLIRDYDVAYFAPGDLMLIVGNYTANLLIYVPGTDQWLTFPNAVVDATGTPFPISEPELVIASGPGGQFGMKIVSALGPTGQPITQTLVFIPALGVFAPIFGTATGVFGDEALVNAQDEVVSLFGITNGPVCNVINYPPTGQNIREVFFNGNTAFPAVFNEPQARYQPFSTSIGPNTFLVGAGASWHTSTICNTIGLPTINSDYYLVQF